MCCKYCGSSDNIPGTDKPHYTKCCLVKLFDQKHQQVGQNSTKSWREHEKSQGRVRAKPSSDGTPYPETATKGCTPERFEAIRSDRSLNTVPKGDLYPGKGNTATTTELAQSAEASTYKSKYRALRKKFSTAALRPKKKAAQIEDDDSESGSESDSEESCPDLMSGSETESDDSEE